MKDKIEFIINGKHYVVTDESFKFVVDDNDNLRITYGNCGVCINVKKAE